MVSPRRPRRMTWTLWRLWSKARPIRVLWTSCPRRWRTCPQLQLSWLLLRDYLVDQGASGISGSRDAVREAVVRGLLPENTEQVWMAMIRSRNLTSYTYNPDLAHQIASLIEQEYAPALEALLVDLTQRAQRR